MDLIKEGYIMAEVIGMLPILGIAILMNVLMGTFYNVSVKELAFDRSKFIDGIFKALSIAFTFIGLAFCFDRTDLLRGVGVTPMMIMDAAIVVYVTKVLVNLCKVLGVENIKPGNP